LRLPRWLLILGLVTLAVNLALFVLAFPLSTLDARLSYEPREVGALFWKLGEAGRARYALVARIDCFFIGLYTVFLIALARHWGKGRYAFYPACIFTLLMALFDTGETLGIRYLLELFPAADKPVEQLVSRCTSLKWGAAFWLAISMAWLWKASRAGARKIA
jgi:hypothetical protein